MEAILASLQAAGVQFACMRLVCPLLLMPLQPVHGASAWLEVFSLCSGACVRL